MTDYTLLGAGGWAAATYDLLVPSDAINVYSTAVTASGASFLGYPTLPLIDLQTMEVLVQDCWDYPTSGARDYAACIGDNL